LLRKKKNSRDSRNRYFKRGSGSEKGKGSRRDNAEWGGGSPLAGVKVPSASRRGFQREKKAFTKGGKTRARD